MLDEYVVQPSDLAKARFFAEEDGEQESVRTYLNGLDDGPDAVLVRHSDGARGERHFHHGSQFQLMLDGSIEFPRFRLERPAVFYTDHNTAYGPFTMRQNHQMLVLHARPAGQVWVKEPGSAARINRSGRQIPGSAPGSWEPLPGVEGARRKVLIDESAGPSVQIVSLEPGVALSVGETRYGRFEFITEGSAELHGTELERETLRFVRGERPFDPLVAAGSGATVVVLSFDEDATRGERGGLSIADRLAGFREVTREEVGALAVDPI